MKKFIIQIESSLVVGREIKAESMEEALRKATEFANANNLVKPKSRSWGIEYDTGAKVVAVLA